MRTAITAIIVSFIGARKRAVNASCLLAYNEAISKQVIIMQLSAWYLITNTYFNRINDANTNVTSTPTTHVATADATAPASTANAASATIPTNVTTDAITFVLELMLILIINTTIATTTIITIVVSMLLKLLSLCSN